MRIGFDGSCLSNRRGFGRFSRRLLHALTMDLGPHELVVIIDAPSADLVSLPAGLERIVGAVDEAPRAAASAQGPRTFREMVSKGWAVPLVNPDLCDFPAPL